MVCNYRYKNRQCHCLSGGYMARSAKPRKRKPASQRSKLPRYVVKLHEDDFLTKKTQKFCALIVLTMPLNAAQT
ncbi:hypothetical protein, partial [Escherichia coli]|uniref:hypothetical protein n=1 Tax=Escherichia coli TaxID=562 RepID=UPI001BC868F3